MGNGFGQIPSNTVSLTRNPEITPEPFSKPSFDPLLGFEGRRKEREMIASEVEMMSAKLKLNERDYCAHLLLKYRACRRENFPFVVRCHHEKHDFLNCQYDDFVLRMKEYERERRLLIRQQKEFKEQAALLNE